MTLLAVRRIELNPICYGDNVKGDQVITGLLIIFLAEDGYRTRGRTKDRHKIGVIIILSCVVSVIYCRMLQNLADYSVPV